MTKVIAAAAAKAARPDTVIRAVESAFGPPSIEGAYDDAFAVPGLLERIKEGEAEGADAHVIACFDDTGLDAARALANAPVVGHRRSRVFRRRDAGASLLRRDDAGALGAGDREQPVTLRPRPALRARARVRRAGAGTRQSRLRTHARRSQTRSHARSTKTARKRSCSAAPAWRISRPRFGTEFGVPVIDGVGAAVVLAEGLAAIGLRTSKRGGYARPLAKAYSGAFAPFSPQG